MNARLNDLFARRSVRKFASREVTEQTVRDILEAAMAAPSAVAKDPWDFIVVRDGTMRAKIAACLPNGKMLAESPVGIIVCGDIKRAHDNQVSYLLQDCSAAIENLLLAVSMLGLGACWLGVHPREARIAGIRGLLTLPEDVVPVAAVAVGWPADKTVPRTRYEEKRVHQGKW
jgi:nitroreductase